MFGKSNNAWKQWQSKVTHLISTRVKSFKIEHCVLHLSFTMFRVSCCNARTCKRTKHVFLPQASLSSLSCCVYTRAGTHSPTSAWNLLQKVKSVASRGSSRLTWKHQELSIKRVLATYLRKSRECFKSLLKTQTKERY
jgi:hypothetical protein